MERILFVGQHGQEVQKLLLHFKQLEANVGNMVLDIADPAHLSRELKKNYGLLVISCDRFTQKHWRSVHGLKSYGHLGCTIIVGQPDNETVLREAERFEHIAFVEKPYETKDLQGVALKMIRFQKVRQRIFRRYQTSQRAQIEPYTNSHQCDATVLNLSKGGAYIEGAFEGAVTVGEVLKLHVHLDDIARQHTVSARVVWKRPQKRQGKEGIGLEFIRKDEIYKYLIGSL